VRPTVKRSRLAVLAATSTAIALAFTGCSAPAPSDNPSGAPETASVRFALPVPTPDAGQVWAYMPSYAGFFAEQGLEVEFIPNDGGTAALQQVATGNAEFSISNPQALLNAVGAGLGVVGVATVVPRQIYGFYVPEDSAIKDYSDLEGKNVGISSPTSGVYPFAQAALAEAGLDYQADVSLVTTGGGAPQLQALSSGGVDAIASFDTAVATFANLGTNLRALPPTSVADDPADLLVTNVLFLKDNSDLVVRFAKALFQAIEFAQQNPDEALAAFKDQFPQSSEGATDEENLRVIQSRLDTLQLTDAQNGWGDIPLDGYQHLQEVGVEFGSIPAAQDFSRVFDTSLLSQMQDFGEATPAP
jgi:NitT/TauT family transport system substrate-binding protein